MLVRLEQEGQWPALLFRNVAGSAHSHLINVFADLRRLAMAMDTDLAGLPAAFRARSRQPVAPVTVSPSAAPVKQKVWVGEEARINRLPVIHYHALDAGPYISGGVSITRDPTSGRTNLGIYRMQVHSPQTLGINIAPMAHGHRTLSHYWEAGKPMPIAIAIGHHPGLYLTGAGNNDVALDEYHLAGGLVGEPLELVPAETCDLLVPARAEIVIEGEIPPGEQQLEAPYGEFTGVYGEQGPRPILRVKAITCRQDAIYQSIMVGHADNLLIGLVGRLGAFFEEARKVSPGVRNIHIPVSGRGRYACYVAMKPRSAGEVQEVLLRLLTVDSYIKYVVAVDEDIDIYSDAAVMHEIFTKVRPREDVFIVPGVKACSIDPVTEKVQGAVSVGGIFDKVAIDATTPTAYPQQIRVPGVADVDLSLYRPVRPL